MKEKIIKIVSESFEEDFDIKEFDMKFEEFDGWDSLTAMVLIDKLNEKFEIEIQVDEINEMSVNTLFKLINN